MPSYMKILRKEMFAFFFHKAIYYIYNTFFHLLKHTLTYVAVEGVHRLFSLVFCLLQLVSS